MSAQGGPDPAGRRALLHDPSLASADSRWTRIKAVFLEALEHPEPGRADFVAERCGADADLRAEVLSLLSSDREAGSFCEAPAGVLLGLEDPGDGLPHAPPPRLAPGTRLGAYEIEGFLRSGGMGEVYRGRHTVLERAVAIKTVPSASGADARRRLLREARHASLLRHPNACTIHEAGEVAGLPFIVMELVDGRPLSDLIRERALSLDAALGHALAVADALAHAHEQGIVHRDLKSSNVMVDRSGRAVVLDFGLAKRLPTHQGAGTGESITAAGALAGTLSHMAPEVLQGGAADVRSDIWSLGVMLYELATGQLPFRGSTPFETSAAILEGTLTWPPNRLPLALRLVIRRCLAKDPDARYQTAAEVREALGRVRRRRTWSLTGRLLLTGSPGRLRAAAAILVALAAAAGAGPAILDWLAGVPGPPIHALTVLPLENTTADPRLDYYAAGLSEGLLSELGAALDVRVVAGAASGGGYARGRVMARWPVLWRAFPARTRWSAGGSGWPVAGWRWTST